MFNMNEREQPFFVCRYHVRERTIHDCKRDLWYAEPYPGDLDQIDSDRLDRESQPSEEMVVAGIGRVHHVVENFLGGIAARVFNDEQYFSVFGDARADDITIEAQFGARCFQQVCSDGFHLLEIIDWLKSFETCVHFRPVKKSFIGIFLVIVKVVLATE